MSGKKKIKWEKINDNITYRIIDNTIYLIFHYDSINSTELRLICKRIALLIEDNGIQYINVTSGNMENIMGVLKEFGFVLSSYDVCKINLIYDGTVDKKMYRTYGIMTKSDFLNSLKEVDKVYLKDDKVISSNSGFVSNVLLLFGGIILLCYFCVQGAIYLVKQKGRCFL